MDQIWKTRAMEHYHNQASKYGYLDPLTFKYRTDPDEENLPGVIEIGEKIVNLDHYLSSS